MKIQELAIIFIIIILPISLILSVYTQSQIQTLNTQTLYDAKLTAASFDAIKAFQINTANSTTSNIANSKIRDLEASLNIFKTSIASAFGMNGISEEELNEYIPALVYTLYDGFYVYSPYINKNDLGINNDGEAIYGLQPYIPYSCQYKWDSNDVVITYSLDNYISIKGMINGKYITDEGYLVGGIKEDASTGKITYKGVAIEKETELKENIAGIEYPYRKINGTKYYYDKGGEAPGETNNIYNDEIFYLSNGERVTQGELKGEKAAQYYHTVIKNNTSAIQYYKEAMEFTKRVEDYGLSSITYQNAYDPSTGNRIWSNNRNKIFAQEGSSEIDENIEYELSNFTQHKLSVIRYVIEKNLSEVIANYNTYSITAGIDFQMPELTETEWDNVIKNISLISFVQGLPIGGKIYNGYTIVNNTESKEVVKEEDIYVIGDDNYYHKIGDIYLEDTSNINNSIPAGRLKLDFKRSYVLDGDNESKYYYPREEYASYNSVVTQNSDNVNTYDDIYGYLEKIEDSQDLLKETFYSALGRERKGAYKLFNADSYEHDILIIGKSSKQTELKAITDYINNNTDMKARYKCDPSRNYLNEQKENYSLIIIDAIEDDVEDLISISDLNNLSNYTNIMTIGAKNTLGNFATVSGNKTGGVTLKTVATEFGESQNVYLNVEDRIVERANWSNFNEQVKVLYTTQYIENGRVEEHDSIGYLKTGDYAWMNSQISLGEKESDYQIISKLAELTIEGITEGTTRILLAALGNSVGDEEYVKSINNRLNTNSNIESTYIFGLNSANIEDKIKRRAANYDLIIIDTFDNDLPVGVINYIRNYVINKPNIITISSKTSSDLGIVQGSESLATVPNITPVFTSLGQQYLNQMGDVGIAQTDMKAKVTFQSRAKILCEDSSSRNDLIAYWEDTSGLVWIHSAINIKRGSESNNTSGEKLIEQLAQLSIHRQDSCTIVFDPNGGQFVQPIRGFINEVIKLPSCNKVGGRFLGWDDTSTAVQELYQPGNDYTITEQSVVLKAVWDESLYTITFDPNGGEVSPTYMTGGYGAKITLPKPFVREGYTFNGWLKGTERYMDGVQYEITTSETLRAKWTPIIYRITLDPNGGEVNPSIIEAPYGEWIDLPTPTKEGYDFKGWRVGNNIYSAGENVYQVTTERNMEAKWEISKYKITFDTKGGAPIETIEGREGQEIRLPTPTKTNCEFVEWVSTDGTTYSAGDYYVIEKSDTLTAKWLRIETKTISNWHISVTNEGGYFWNDHRGAGRIEVELPERAKYIKIESISMNANNECSCCASNNNMWIYINGETLITGNCVPYRQNGGYWSRTVPTGKIELNQSQSYLTVTASVTNDITFNMKYKVYIPE